MPAEQDIAALALGPVSSCYIALAIPALFPSPGEGATHTRRTFFVDGCRLDNDTVSRMYVECLEPSVKLHPVPIVLIHDDWHTGQVWITKPDGSPGFASHLVQQGAQVYVVDLPSYGRSPVLVSEQTLNRATPLSAETVEAKLTAVGKASDTPPFPTAHLHNKWPGTGLRGDASFEAHYASMAVPALTKLKRQLLSQRALAHLLDRIGRAALVGHGSGATMAWLAADARPALAAATVALDPAGPPCSKLVADAFHACPLERKFGLADAALTYDPPVPPHLTPREWPLAVAPVAAAASQRVCMLQLEQPPRRLVNLAQAPHAVFTAQASAHARYDWATVEFMKQAGLTVFHFELEHLGVYGNGHLMMLETNSHSIAQLVAAWICFNVKYE